VIESLVINPDEFTTAFPEVSLHELGLEVGKEGADWGEAQVALQLSRQQIGSVVTDRHLEPVEMSIPLVAMEEGEATTAGALYRLQQAVGLLQADEYNTKWIGREFSTDGGFSGMVGYVILSASLDGVQGRGLAHNNIATDISLKALRSPLCYAAVESESEEFSGEEVRHLIFELEELLGSHPGLIRIRVTNENSEGDWNGLIVAGECRDHPQDETADTTAALHYAAADLTPKGGAEVVEVGGEDVVEHDGLTAGWLTILGSEIDEVGHMTHQGVRDIWVRAEDLGEEAGDVELKLRSRSLGTLNWTEHDIVPSPLVDDQQLIYVGQVRPRAAALGEGRWEFEIQARAPSGAGKVRLYDVYPLPDEQLVVLSSPGTSQGADSQSAKTPGTMADDSTTGSIAWSNVNNAKTSDNTYATAEPGTTQATHYLKASKFAFALPEGATVVGIIASVERKVSTLAGGIIDYKVNIVKGGTIKAENKAGAGGNWQLTDTIATYGAADDLWGETWTVADINEEGFGVALSAWCGGSKATVSVDAITLTVYYTEAADDNRVCFASRSVELRSDGCYRQHPEDDVWGDVIPEGDLLLAPVAGLEGRKARFIVIPSSGDLDEVADEGAHDLSAQVFDRAAYLFAPQAT
jgi:hypothetical protein